VATIDKNSNNVIKERQTQLELWLQKVVEELGLVKQEAQGVFGFLTRSEHCREFISLDGKG
jgi:hypothetical protein